MDYLVYTIHPDNLKEVENHTNFIKTNEFLQLCKNEGDIYWLEEFETMLNADLVSDQNYFRIVTETKHYEIQGMKSLLSLKQSFIDRMIEDIKKDITNGDFTVIDEILNQNLSLIYLSKYFED